MEDFQVGDNYGNDRKGQAIFIGDRREDLV